MPVSCVRRPSQNTGHVPGSTVLGSQVLTYGPRTTSGTAGGRIGWAAEDVRPADPTPAAPAAPVPAAATTAPEARRKLRRLRGSRGRDPGPVPSGEAVRFRQS